MVYFDPSWKQIQDGEFKEELNQRNVTVPLPMDSSGVKKRRRYTSARSSFSLSYSTCLLKMDVWNSDDCGCNLSVPRSLSVRSWARLACVANISSVSQLSQPFSEWTNMAALWGPQIWSRKSTSFMSVFMEQANEECRKKYLHFYIVIFSFLGCLASFDWFPCNQC